MHKYCKGSVRCLYALEKHQGMQVLNAALQKNPKFNLCYNTE